MSVDEGKRVTFNNFSIDASALSGNNLPPVIINNIELQELIEQGDGMEFNLNNIFSDPDNDPLVFSCCQRATNNGTSYVDRFNNKYYTVEKR